VLSRQRRTFPQVLADDEGGLRRETYRTASAEIEEQIETLLAVGVGQNPRESLSELARLGVRLIIQRAVEDEFDAWLGRARYERRAGSARGPGDERSALRNGFRPRKVHTLEGELEVDIPQARAAAEPFVSMLFPCSTKVLRTEPLRAMVIGAFVRGLSMRDIETLSSATRLEPRKRRTLPTGPLPSCIRADGWLGEQNRARSSVAKTRFRDGTSIPSRPPTSLSCAETEYEPVRVVADPKLAIGSKRNSAARPWLPVRRRSRRRLSRDVRAASSCPLAFQAMRKRTRQGVTIYARTRLNHQHIGSL
jgi:hypothetical protein